MSARDGDGEWRWREGGVAWAGEWRMGGGDPGGEDGGGGAVNRVIGDEEVECSGGGRVRGFWGLEEGTWPGMAMAPIRSPSGNS